MAGNPVPTTFAPDDELTALARETQRVGGRVLQSIPAGVGDIPVTPKQQLRLEEADMRSRISRETGQPIVFSTGQIAGTATYGGRSWRVRHLRTVEADISDPGPRLAR